MQTMTGNTAGDHYGARLRKTEKALREALERLVKGIPTHPKLKDAGYRLNVSTLALEARVSRNAIYTNHKGIAEDLKAAQRRSKRMPKTIENVDDKVRELRAIIREQELEKRKLATENALLIHRLHQKDEEIATLKAKQDKLQARPVES